MPKFKDAMSGEPQDLLSMWLANVPLGGLKPDPHNRGDFNTNPMSSARLADPNQVPMGPENLKAQHFSQLMFGTNPHRNMLINALRDWYLSNHSGLAMRGGE